MKNYWLERSKIEFIFFGSSFNGVIYNVNHPVLKHYDGDGELVPLTTRILVNNERVRIIWSPESVHGKMVKLKAESLIKSLFRWE